MKKFFVPKNVEILSLFQDVVNIKRVKISSYTFRKAFKEIGFEFDYSLIEDLKRKIVADQLYKVDSKGNQVLNAIVALFTDHLLIRRIERSKDRRKAFDMRFSDLFVKEETARQYMTKRQYKTSITFMYRNLPKVTQRDPFLLLMYPRNEEVNEMTIKKSDCIKFLISRERVIEQISSEIRNVSSLNELTVNEKDFIRIYNRCLSFIQELAVEDTSLITNKESIFFKK